MDKKYVEDTLNKGLDAMVRIDAENDFIEQLCADVEEKEGIKASEVKSMIKAAHKDDTQAKIDKLTDLQEKLREFKLA